MYPALPPASFKERLLYFLGRRIGIAVEGDTMQPTLFDGEIVLADPWRRPKSGDIAVIRHPEDKDLQLIKRVAATDTDGKLLLADDYDGNLQTRSCLLSEVVGTAVCRYDVRRE